MARCRCNVDMLKLIKLGLTFSNAEGNLPKCSGELCVWQFNFRLQVQSKNTMIYIVARFCQNVFVLRFEILCCREFKLSEDMYAQDSIELLKNSGIDFACNEQRGINVHRFGELLMSSGIVLSDEARAVA